jgi:hypothetical protein
MLRMAMAQKTISNRRIGGTRWCSLNVETRRDLVRVLALDWERLGIQVRGEVGELCGEKKEGVRTPDGAR